MSGMMLDLSEIYVTACERQEQEVEKALKEVEALHLSLCTAQQHFPTADLAAKPALWSQMDADIDLALKTFKAMKVHFLTLDGITTTIFNPHRVALNFRPRNLGHLHKSAWDSLLAFGAIRGNMVALVSEEEADAKRNMEEKLLHLGQVFNDQGLEPDKQALEDLEWQIWRAEILLIVSTVQFVKHRPPLFLVQTDNPPPPLFLAPATSLPGRSINTQRLYNLWNIPSVQKETGIDVSALVCLQPPAVW
ncbi:hypothetical protein C1H46_012751 [Malus baccata]|uniref:Uncharacterized protein n=1 Tax=Malus baccata TaxID=106549 RepID=A0A540MSB6_MALBA|nr:hypothetical protein C1H46_012751 [Malus baccata]